MTEPLPTMEFARFVTSSVPPASEARLTVSLALPIRFSMREDAGPPAPPFFSPALEPEAPPVSATALMDSTRFQQLSALLALLNAPPAMADPTTAHLACKVQCPSMELAQLPAARTSSASRESAWLVQSHATDAQSPQPTA